MSLERHYNVILSPVITEKSTLLTEHNQVVFKVRTDADKKEIRQAVEMLFDVEVSGVTVANYAGKLKRHGRDYGQRAAWKKAYVTLAPGSQIDFLAGE